MGKKLTKDEFIKKANKIHKDKYDYSKVDYVNSNTKVCIICPEHGEFWQAAGNHTQGQGCQKCGFEKNRKSFSLTTEDFIKKANEVHNGKYNYDKVEYKNANTKVCIICSEHDHGEFWQRPSQHLMGQGCPKCAQIVRNDSHRLSLHEFIKKANEIHNGKYNYSKVKYVNAMSKVCIICPKHGEFWQTASNHTQGNGCPKCSGNYIPTTEEWIVSVNEKHNGKYDYSKVKYVDAFTKVCIICPKHGEFWQQAYVHKQGFGCPKCANEANSERFRSSKEDFIKRANEVHCNKYDYSKVNYENNRTKVCIICSKHGEFWQSPDTHIQGCGCPECGRVVRNDSLRLSLTDFIKRANEVHGNKYYYQNVDYKGSKTKVCIICKDHGEFWQSPNGHLHGYGCPKCNLSHLERSVMTYLDENGITYDYQKRFNWLGKQSLDFYLPDYKVGIECQGRQHFFPIDYFGGDKGFKNTLQRDKQKFNKCQKHGIKLLYYSDLGMEYPYEVFEDVDLLFKEIKNIQVKKK